MKRALLAIGMAVVAGCASQPGADGPGRPLRDTTRVPGEQIDPPEAPPIIPGNGGTDSTTQRHQ